MAQRLSAFLDSEDPASVQFHVRPPNDDGFMPEPWGYFSTEHDPSHDETMPIECLGVDNASRKLLFSNNSPGVSAVIKYVCTLVQIISGSAAITGIITK